MGRKFTILEKKYFGHTSGAQKLSAARLDTPPETRKIAVYGTGRCGTSYTAKVLRAVGLDVHDQHVGPDGTSSHWFFADSEWFPQWPGSTRRDHQMQRRSDFLFEHEVHLVRHPLTCIPSLRAVHGLILHEFAVDNGILKVEEVEAPHIVRSALWWLRVNQRIGKLRPAIRIRMEDYEKSWPWLAFYAGLDKKTPFPKHVKPRKPSRWSPVTPMASWAALRNAVGDNLFKNIQQLAKEYGYA